MQSYKDRYILIVILTVLSLICMSSANTTKYLTAKDFTGLEVIPIFENGAARIYLKGASKKYCIATIGNKKSGNTLIFLAEAKLCVFDEYKWKKLDGKYALPDDVDFVALGDSQNVIFDYKRYREKKVVKIPDKAISESAGKGFYLPKDAYAGDKKGITVEKKEVVAAERAVIKYLANNNLILYGKYGSYKKQYFGFTRTGKRFLLINYFCNDLDATGEKLSRELFVVNDGGDCFFSITVDLNTMDVNNLYVNGEA